MNSGPANIARLCFIVAVLFAPGDAAAQTTNPLQEASAAVESLDYAAARQILTAFIAQPARATTHDLAQAHLLMGIIDYSQGNIDAARTEFRAAIQLQQEIRPNRSSVSPKIVEFFDSIRASTVPVQSAVETRYVTIVDQRPAAAIRSMVLPGWGQYYKGDRAKAFVAGASWFATAGATAVAHGVRRRARIRYTDETDPDLIVDRYDAFNRAHKVRNTLAVSAGAVWLVAYIDALMSPGRRLIEPLSVAVLPAPGGVTFTAFVSF